MPDLSATVYLILAAPTLAILLSLLIARPRFAEYLNLAAAALVFALAAPLPWRVHEPLVWLHGYLLLDRFAAWVTLCTATVYLLASLYSIGYMRQMAEAAGRLHRYYALFAAFGLTMLLAPVQNNPGLYWICIDLTTIVSAFLVGFQREPECIEAAWKYIVLVSAGLALALLGTVLFYWGGTFTLGPVYAMTWASLDAVAPHVAPALLILSFLLVAIGFGTKVGLAPMHTWLPDAHSEGPAPVSAMLSGALLNCAMLGVVRYLGVLERAGLGALPHIVLIVLGAFSLLVAALFITRQTGAKRLMAYSSVEHMGVVALGFGFGGPLGVAGALFHMLNHSLNKSLMFFGAGNMMHAYRSKDMEAMRRIGDFSPVTGSLWLAGAIAITGAPPFALFISEFTILRAGFAGQQWWAALWMGLLLIVIFIGFLAHFRRMYYGAVPDTPPARALSTWQTAPMWLSLLPLLLLGLWLPHGLWALFQHIAASLGVGAAP
ncbi:proton-conducting transporter membrane subunit [Acidihalobacter ferrooxydans]|uniref:NADH dehydrogenase n=1 Tax=Acidihalobacter ferrooxydans TaxID=1765967 RepID=A0A1P8UGX4_9GAMM|nr:proton-conducting transporter membrane subunit [Acidihalobacter ferrooxydans]APZ43086.1 NADH dehydrogenase [Acidihalobacter ferrooxydans]